MVDPNRKINRLTDKDIEFLDECEEEFSNRFTDDDPEYVEHCSKAYCDPPVVDNWGHGGTGHGNRNNGGGYRNNYGNSGGSRGKNRWNQHSVGGRDNRGYGGHRNNFRDRHPHSHPYHKGDGAYRDNRQHENSSNSSSSKYTPMNIPKGYGNFVAASRTED